MALPRMNNFSFWLLVAAFSLLILSLFMPGGGRPRAGRSTRRWCCRPATRYRSRSSPSTWRRLLDHGRDQHHRHHHEHARAGMTLLKMPLFTWTWLITAYLLIAVMPVFAGAVTMLLTDHFFGTTFFAAPAAATRCSTSTSSGSSGTPRSTS